MPRDTAPGFSALPLGGLHGAPHLWHCGYRKEGAICDHPLQGDMQQGSRHSLIPAEWVSSPSWQGAPHHHCPQGSSTIIVH
jgi:hypothetical protein